MHKLTGSASLRIRYETDKSLYGFEPCLEYASLFAPIEIYGRWDRAYSVQSGTEAQEAYC